MTRTALIVAPSAATEEFRNVRYEYGNSRDYRGRQSEASQTMAVPSWLAVKQYLPSGEKVTLVTARRPTFLTPIGSHQSTWPSDHR